MDFYKKRKPFISLVCVFSLLISIFSISVDAADTNRVTASTNTTVQQGNYAYTYVSIDSTEDLASLEITVHFDPTKIRINNVSNSIGATIYDSAINTDNIQVSYILDGKGTTVKTRLFYFQYQVLSSAEVGDTYFDITVGEAYNNALEEMGVSGSRCKFAITESVTNKSCSVYGSSAMPTSVGQEFTLSYRFSTYQIASGTAIITYDAELFEVVEVAEGAFLSGKVADINTDLTGEIYVSFVGAEYNSNTNLITATFKPIKNVTETSKITLTTPELVDKDLNPISCSGLTTNVNVAYDATYVGDAPEMRLDGTFSYENMQVTLVVSLEAGSNLGAGDFTITFDPALLTYKSCTKGFDPDFFLINDKDTAAGKLKYHILSTSDIVTEETVLTVVFDVNHPYDCKTADFTLDGTGLTDSLTESVLINFIDDSVLLEYRVIFQDADGTILQSSMYHYGDIVQEPDVPLSKSDIYGTYTFTGWDKPVAACTADATYTATYSLEYTDYTVIFQDWDGTVLSSKTYHYGDTVEVPADPSRDADSTYTYVFAGWDQDIVNCEGNATYTATYTPAYIDYTVVFEDWDGTVLSSKTYHYGDAVEEPDAPAREADSTYTYIFAGWDQDVVSCEGNATYTATYTPTYIDYTVVFEDWDGTVLSSKTYHYGDAVEVPDTPARVADEIYTYTFAGWGKDVVSCEGNASYTATYNSLYVNHQAEDHFYGDPVFNWNSDYNAAQVTVTVDCGNCVQSGKETLTVDCKISCITSEGTLKFTASATLPNGQSVIDDTQYIEVKKFATGMVTIEMSLVEADASADMIIIIAGYDNNGKLVGSQIVTDATGQTVIPLTITGEAIGVFFLEPNTYAPLTQSIRV